MQLEKTIVDSIEENLVQSWVNDAIEVNPSEKSKSETKTDVINSIKNELTNFKVETDYNNISSSKYGLIHMMVICFNYLGVEGIIMKVEKDLAELEA